MFKVYIIGLVLAENFLLSAASRMVLADLVLFTERKQDGCWNFLEVYKLMIHFLSIFQSLRGKRVYETCWLLFSLYKSPKLILICMYLHICIFQRGYPHLPKTKKFRNILTNPLLRCANNLWILKIKLTDKIWTFTFFRILSIYFIKFKIISIHKAKCQNKTIWSSGKFYGFMGIALETKWVTKEVWSSLRVSLTLMQDIWHSKLSGTVVFIGKLYFKFYPKEHLNHQALIPQSNRKESFTKIMKL